MNVTNAVATIKLEDNKVYKVPSGNQIERPVVDDVERPMLDNILKDAGKSD